MFSLRFLPVCHGQYGFICLPSQREIVPEITNFQPTEAYHASEHCPTIIEQSHNLIVALDAHGGLCYANPWASSFLGVSPSQLAGASLVEFIHPEDRASFLQWFEENILAKKAAASIENRLINKRTETVRYVLLTADFLYDDHGRSVGAHAMAVDISHRKKSEYLLRKEVEEWQRIFDGLNEIITLQDTNFRIIRANREACRAFAMPESELVGKFCFELFRNSKSECEVCPVAKARESFQPYSCEINYEKLGRIYEVSAFPIKNDAEEIESIVHFAKDITRQKMLEAQYNQAQKMECVGRLASGIAHDFNNLLNVIIGISDLGLLRMEDPSKLKENFAAIKEAGLQAAAITGQLLAFSRKQVLEKNIFSLNGLIADQVKILQRFIGREITIEFLPDAREDAINADAGMIQQVLMNLVINARDAMPEGGRISIRTVSVAAFDQEVCDKVVLTVSDTGMGIAPEVLDKIFEPFFTTKENGLGTGLGLASVSSIVEQHDGSIEVSSTPGEGTSFEIFLPAVCPRQGRKSAESNLGAGTETILVVDNDETSRKVITKLLEALGYTVLAAANGKEALETVARASTGIDLVLTEVVMPQMSGPKLMKKLDATMGRRVKRVFVSGYADETLSRHGLQPRGLHYLRKPLTLKQLAGKIRKALDADNSDAVS